MERDESLRAGFLAVGVEVDDERGQRERRQRDERSPEPECPPPREIPGEERQDEEGCVPDRPGRLGRRDLREQPGDLDGDGRGTAEQERVDPATSAASRGHGLRGEELLPEPAAVLPGELPRQRVDVPEPLDADQEALVRGEPRRLELRDLLPEMILELVDVPPLDRGRGGDVRAPLLDPLVQGEAHASPSAVRKAPGQTWPNVRATVSHWRCCSASASRPSSVSV